MIQSHFKAFLKSLSNPIKQRKTQAGKEGKTKLNCTKYHCAAPILRFSQRTCSFKMKILLHVLGLLIYLLFVIVNPLGIRFTLACSTPSFDPVSPTVCPLTRSPSPRDCRSWAIPPTWLASGTWVFTRRNAFPPAVALTHTLAP